MSGILNITWQSWIVSRGQFWINSDAVANFDIVSFIEMIMIGKTICYVPLVGMTQLEINSIIYFNVGFSVKKHPEHYTLTSILNAHNKNIKMKIFDQHSSWHTEHIAQDQFVIYSIMTKTLSKVYHCVNRSLTLQ